MVYSENDTPGAETVSRENLEIVRGGLPVLLPSKTYAAGEGALVVSGFRAGVREVIGACVRTNDVVQQCGDDDEAFDAFLAVLVEGNIISSAEARLGRASPKLVKLCTIGAHSDLLYHEEIFPYLEPGYTVLYQVVVLYNALDGEPSDRVDELVGILGEVGVSRDALSRRTAVEKRSKKPPETIPAVNDDSKPNGDISRTFDLVLVTIQDPVDLRRLNQDWAIRQRFAELAHSLLADDATAIVVARMTDLPLIENKLLPMLGFEGPSNVFLVRPPAASNVTEAEVLAVVDRRRKPIASDFEWLAADEDFNPNLIAEQLVPGANRKLHLFAPERIKATRGYWMAIRGDSNWGQSDE